jgi:hypothetical protein
LEPGTRIRVTGGNARERQDRSLEVHSSYGTIIEVLEVGVRPVKPVPKWTKIGNLRTGMSSVNVAGRVSNIGTMREFNRRDGGTGKVVSVLLEDETGTVRLSLWDDDVKMVDDMEPSTIIAVENGYTRLSLGDVGLNVGQNGKLQINPENIEVEESNVEMKIVPLRDLREGPHHRRILPHRRRHRGGPCLLLEGTGEPGRRVIRGDPGSDRELQRPGALRRADAGELRDVHTDRRGAEIGKGSEILLDIGEDTLENL